MKFIQIILFEDGILTEKKEIMCYDTTTKSWKEHDVSKAIERLQTHIIDQLRGE